MEKKNYAMAMIKFLDRESGEQKAVTYPITEIELYNVYPDRMPEKVREFKANDEGEWVENVIS